MEPPLDCDQIMDVHELPLSIFSQRQMDQAIAASLDPVKNKEIVLRDGLREVKRLHDADLYKTQDNYQDGSNNDANVLILVKFPESTSTTSCRFTHFSTGRIRLTYEEVLATGSDLLANLLRSERHQRCAKKAAGSLPDGVDYVLDLSPTIDENDYTIALQLLSTTHAVQLWHRSVALGTSPLAVAGHDDVCTCLLPFIEPYPLPLPAESMKSKDGTLCIFDTREWPLEEHRNINDFCTTRWAANTLRLFRAISMPPGKKDLLIDSAPRMWTLVGLFSKLEMTNYDILRDEVVAWFNADMNHAFVELCPEETLRIGHILKTPLLTEPAFRILVNERALEVAGGQPRPQPTTTLFGRRCSDFTGTDMAESLSRMIEHASYAMAERYKIALDALCGDNALDLLDIPQWQELRALDDKIPKVTEDGNAPHIRSGYDRMMAMIRQMFRNAVVKVVQCEGGDLPTELVDSARNDRFRHKGLTTEQIDLKRAFSVPKRDLASTQAFASVYNSLNQHQRALTSIVWQDLSAMTEDLSAFVNKIDVGRYMNEFRSQLKVAQRDCKLLGPVGPGAYGVLGESGVGFVLFRGIMAKLKAYVKPLMTRDEQTFIYTMTPHLVLALNDHEMNFLRLADDESTFQTEAPETDLGPSGPGPAFHTGQTIPSVSDLDFEKLAVESDDGASTVVGSMAVQDGVSTVYDRNCVLARSTAPSIASEQFTDGSMSLEYADAEYEVPAGHQTHGQTLSQIAEQPDDDDDDDEYEYDAEDLDLDSDRDSDTDTSMDNNEVDEVEPRHADYSVDDAIVETETAAPVAHAKQLHAATLSEDSDDSDFELIMNDEAI